APRREGRRAALHPGNAVVAKSTCDEAIQSCWGIPGLLRGACHRAALRADPLARNDGIAGPTAIISGIGGYGSPPSRGRQGSLRNACPHPLLRLLVFCTR